MKNNAKWQEFFKKNEYFLLDWLKSGKPLPRIGIFVVTYNHANILSQTLQRIPKVVHDIISEIFIFDDASHDATYLVAEGFKKVYGMDKITIKRHQQNLGYGGNQKAGYLYAIEKNLDYVILLHGDGQYAPEALPCMIRPVLENHANVVFGSRMIIPGEATSGGMPLYKYWGNKILTNYENLITGLNLSEYHSGYRLYSTNVLRKIPFKLNSNDFHFDNEIILQVHELGDKIYEIPMPSYYGDEICYVNGIKYAWNVFKTALEFKLYRYGLRQDARFTLVNVNTSYQLKKNPFSSHMRILQEVPHNTTVLDIGCSYGQLLPFLLEKGCKVSGADILSPDTIDKRYKNYHLITNETAPVLPIKDQSFDVVILADVIEHVKSPMQMLAEVHRVLRDDGVAIASTGNIALFVYRLLLLFGIFPYSRRGILDESHLHLYTFKSFRKLFEQAEFTVLKSKATPIPFELMFRGRLGEIMTYVYYPFAKLFPKLFGYQCVLNVQKNTYR